MNSISLSNTLVFEELNDSNLCDLCRCYKSSPYLISDYSFGIKRMWQKVLNPSFTLAHGCLIVKCHIRGETFFDYPLPVKEDADVTSALTALNEYCRENFLAFRLQNVPETEIERVLSFYKRCEISYRREYSDYLYETDALCSMAGRAYASIRNHIKRFYARYPGAVFTAFGREDIPRIRQFLRRFTQTFSKGSDSAKTELGLAEAMISHVGSSCFACGGFVLDGEILSFCLSERCGETLVNHVEKALPEFEGIYPATVQAFLQDFGGNARYCNREDDAAERGLRMSKLQYRPCRILHKYSIHIKNELSQIDTVPSLVSERLTYDAIGKTDIDAYNKLCLDDERNRYWGYDYRQDCENPDREYFFCDQKKDFDHRMSLSFAIRYEGAMIGEIVLHNFDGNGSAEIGIRLLPSREGMGYGREALRTVIAYALYRLGLDRVTAKCYQENRPSSHMLSSVMRLDHTDETFEHYVSTF